MAHAHTGDAVTVGNGPDAIDAAHESSATNGAPKTLGAALDRAAFLKHAKESRPLHRVDLPDVGEGAHVFVRGLSATGKDKFEDKVYTAGPGGKMVADITGVRALMVRLCTCGADGALLFTDEDLPALAELDAKTADAIYSAASRHSGLSQKDVEDILKNSGIIPAAAQS